LALIRIGILKTGQTTGSLSLTDVATPSGASALRKATGYDRV